MISPFPANIFTLATEDFLHKLVNLLNYLTTNLLINKQKYENIN